MPEKGETRSVGEHDWHSSSYVDWWIQRDRDRDAVRRQRLAAYASRVEFAQADLLEPSWTERVGGPFDLAVSAIAIHNLRDIDAIAACYRGIAGLLNPEAAFLDYDLFFDSIGGLARHLELLREAGFASVECLWQNPPNASLVAFTG